MNSAIRQYLKEYGFEQFRPKAVLFDMDGVIYDSMANHAIAWVKAMEKFGLKMEASDAYKYEGMRGVETIKLLAREQWQRELSDDEAAHMYTVKTEIFNSCPPAEKMAGVETVMRRVKDSGLTIGVVTGSGQRVLLDKLESDFPGLVSRQYVVCSFDVDRGKPSPEPYLKGLERCGNLKPWEAIVVENAPLGVRAAHAAQIFTLAVNTGPLPHSSLIREGAYKVFECMADLAAAIPLQNPTPL
jgi:HAD superfamily hydrolase (TIGR01509 family)